jgi:hypothetical protein
MVLMGILVALVTLFWGLAGWLFSHRNDLDWLNARLPIFSRYREQRFRPLFRRPSDVVWFAVWWFLLGVTCVIILLVRL